MTRHHLLLGLSLLGACAADVPESPSFQQHVMPILAANCVRCHGYPPIGGAPPYLRLDSYGDIAVDDATMIAGAAATAPLIALRARSDQAPMPPRFPLDEPQIETLERWAAGIAPGGLPPRGEPRPGNRAPEVTVEAIAREGITIRVTVRVDDPDGDLVAGELHAQVGGADRVIGPIRSGLVELAWSIAFVPPGNHPLSARVDDGAAPVTLELGQLTVGAP